MPKEDNSTSEAGPDGKCKMPEDTSKELESEENKQEKKEQASDDELPGKDKIRENDAAEVEEVSLEFNDNQFYMKDCRCVCEFALQNNGDHVIKQVRLSLQSGEDLDENRIVSSLDPGGRRVVRFRVEPPKAGIDLLNIILKYRSDNIEKVFCASKKFKVLDKDAAPENITVYYDQRLQAEGSSAISAAKSRINNEIAKGISDGSFNTVNDLIGQDFPDNWVPVQLYPADHLKTDEIDSTSGTSDEKTSEDPFAETGELRLLNKNLGIDINIESDTIIGRANGPFADIFGKYPQISSTHLRITQEPLKGWFVTDLGSFNGTSYNKKKLSPNQPQAVSDGAFLQIANLEFYVQIKRQQAGKTGTVRV